MDDLRELKSAVRRRKNPAKARFLKRFFKTGKGEYGYGDIFFGLTVPQSRSIARRFPDLSPQALGHLMRSPVHEERLISLLILVNQFQTGNERVRARIAGFYLRNLRYVNSWDLVDLSADKILGAYLSGKPKNVLRKLVRSPKVWKRRIAVVATYHFIKNGRFAETLAIIRRLLEDPHDLIHKAAGWMLREVGKRSLHTEERFLKQHAGRMPRTMLRYAIERFFRRKRLAYLRLGK